MFDSADTYSHGLAEEILGKTIKGKRDQVLISTKATFTVWSRPQRRRIVAPPSDQIVRSQPEAAWAPTISICIKCTHSMR